MARLLADYVLSFDITKKELRAMGVKELPAIPKNLFFLKWMADNKEELQEKKND